MVFNSYIKDGGDVIVDTDEFSLKIASDRTIYIRKYDETKFKSMNNKVRKGIPIHEKKALAERLAKKIRDKRKENMIEDD